MAEPFAGPAQGFRNPAVFELDRIGDLLRRARERRGEDFYTIADFLRIRPGFLAALENSSYEELPADAYVLGFLRSYAAYLELDGKAVIDQYRREMAGRRRQPQLNMPKPISESRAPTISILIGAAIAVLLIYALWYGLATSSQDAATAPPVLPQSAVSEAPVPPPNNESATASPAPPAPIEPAAASPAPPVTPMPSAPVEQSLPAASVLSVSSGIMLPASPPQVSSTVVAAANNAPASGVKPPSPESASPAGKAYGSPGAASRLVLRAEKGAWVLVTDSLGNTVFDQILKPGDVYNVPDRKGLKLTTGNGSGIALTLDGADLPRLAADSRIVRNVPLDLERLKAGNTQPVE